MSMPLGCAFSSPADRRRRWSSDCLFNFSGWAHYGGSHVPGLAPCNSGCTVGGGPTKVLATIKWVLTGYALERMSKCLARARTAEDTRRGDVLRGGEVMRKVLIAASVALLMPRGVEAQWLNYPDPRLPRTVEGKPALTAPAPRAFDGKPDLSGVWHVQSESLEEKRRLFGADYGTITVPGMEPTTTSKYGQDVLVDYRPGEIVMTPQAEAIYMRRRQGQEISPTEQCLPAGVPRATLLSEVHKIVQAPGLIIVMHELDGGMSRQIYTDGRP